MKHVILSLIFAGISSLLAAQQTGMISANYQISVPMGEFDDFQPDNSYSGFTLDYYHRLKHDFQFGGLIGWQVFHKRYPRATYVFDDGAVTLKQWHYTHIMPITLAMRYFFVEQERLSPFVGLGTGVYYIRQEIWAGLNEYIYHNWRYGLFPEMGLRLKVVNSFGLIFSSKYNFIVNGQLTGSNDEHMHFWSFNFGLYIALYNSNQ